MDHTSDTIYVSFPVKETKTKDLLNTEVIIWTTTPWTIPANKALAYNQALKYVIVQINDQSDFINRKIVVAKDLLKSVIEDCEIKDYKIVSEIKGSDFHETICLHPFNKLGYDYDIPMLEARFVTTEQG